MNTIVHSFQLTFGTTGNQTYDMFLCCFFIATFTVLIFRLFMDILNKF